MTDRIRSLLKEHKQEIEQNHFDRLIIDCPPMFMQELFDTFYSASIHIPNDIIKNYGEACCYLYNILPYVALSQINWENDTTLFVLNIRGSFSTSVQWEHLRDELSRINISLEKIEQEYNGDAFLHIRAWPRITYIRSTITLS